MTQSGDSAPVFLRVFLSPLLPKWSNVTHSSHWQSGVLTPPKWSNVTYGRVKLLSTDVVVVFFFLFIFLGSMGGSRRKKGSRTSKKNRFLYRYRLELTNGSTRRDSSYVISSSMVSSNWFLASVISRTAAIDVHFLSLFFIFVKLSSQRILFLFMTRKNRAVWHAPNWLHDKLFLICVTSRSAIKTSQNLFWFDTWV